MKPKITLKKKLITALLTVTGSIFSSTTFASADEYKVVFDCTLPVIRPGVGLNLQVLEGGFAGGTTIRISRLSTGHSQVDNYHVKKQPIGPIGSSLVYKGKGINFRINMTTTPNEDGSRTADLSTKQYGQEVLKCEAVN